MIIALVSQKGGVGKSTLATSIAWELMSRKRRVLLVDGDSEQGSSKVTVAAALERGLPTPACVDMGPDMFGPEELPALIAHYDDIVIDTPGQLGETQRGALMVADVALMPVGQTGYEAWSVMKTLNVLNAAQELRPELKVAMVVVRRDLRTDLGKTARDVLQDVGIPILKSETSYRVAWMEAPTAGQGVAQYAPKDAAAKECIALVDELLLMATTRRAYDEAITAEVTLPEAFLEHEAEMAVAHE